MDELKQIKKKSTWKGILIGTLVTGFLVTSIAIAAIIIQGRFLSGGNKSSNSGELIDDYVLAKTDSIKKMIDKHFYFTDQIDEELMKENIYRAVVVALGDQYSEYYTEQEIQDIMTDDSGVYCGMGSYVTMDTETNLPMLSGVFEDSPARDAGLRDGDIIYAVDGELTAGEDLDTVVSKIKGQENTTVTLTIVREGESEPFDVVVTRRKVETPTIESELKEGDIGYIQIKEFIEVTSEQFSQAYENLQNQGMKALIIDLRSNGGGFVNECVEICEELLPEGVITYLIDKDGNRTDYNGRGKDPISIPMVVLVNGYTASASEIMTGAIRDYKAGTIIGTKTFGKGIVQDTYMFNDGSAVKLTTASYYTPSGECIHGIGIDPDIEVEFDGERYYNGDGGDNQIEYAIDYLKEQLK